jgi:tRNA (guanine-N7-)-methyltransferase
MALTVRPFNREQVDPPFDANSFSWPKTFTESAPLDLEIGCGVGWHPIRYAERNPGRRLIAIEHTREKFESFQGRFEKHGLTNLLPVHADAVRWVHHHLKNESIDRVFLLYPNPEPGNPSKRWLRAPFFHRLLEVMKPGAELTLATNIESYFKEALEYGENFWKLGISRQRTIVNPPPDGIPRTHFEKKYLARGESCFDVTFRKP